MMPEPLNPLLHTQVTLDAAEEPAPPEKRKKRKKNTKGKNNVSKRGGNRNWQTGERRPTH
jgi:hypothetical protein